MVNKSPLFLTLLLLTAPLCAMDGTGAGPSSAPTASADEQHAALITAIRAADATRVQALVAQGVNIHANEKEAAREAFKLKAPLKWEILELLQDTKKGAITCIICHGAIDESLPDDNPKSLVHGGPHKLFVGCREDHCFHADCIGQWVRGQERFGSTAACCPYCISHINTESAELPRIHTIVLPPAALHLDAPVHAPVHTHEQTFLNAVLHNDIHTMEQEFSQVPPDIFMPGALEAAVAYNSFEAVQWLVEHDVPIDEEALQTAWWCGHAQMIAYLQARSSWKTYLQARLTIFAIKHPYLLGTTIGAAIGIPLAIALHKLLDRFYGDN